MGFWNRLLGLENPVVMAGLHESHQAPRFAVDSEAIPAQIFGLESYASPVAPEPRISRREAIGVPAVKRSRDLIAGTLGGLPLDYIGPEKVSTPWTLFDQPEPDVPRSVTMARTIEDLLFEGVAWWRVTEVGWHSYPTKVRRLDPRSVNVGRDGKVYYSRGGKHSGMADEWVPDSQLIRFDSANDGLLIAGSRAIRTCLRLEAAAARQAEGAPPLDFFTPSDGMDPADDDDVQGFLDSWKDARQQRSTAYIPAALKYNSAGWSPEQLQMSEARQHCVLEIARLAGVDPEDLGVSTTSRTYANAETRRRDLLDFTLSSYVQAIQDRLSMGDVTPRGYYARLRLDAFLRSDTKTRYDSYVTGLQVGAITHEEIRDLEDRPRLQASDLPQLPSPAEAPQEEADA